MSVATTASTPAGTYTITISATDGVTTVNSLVGLTTVASNPATPVLTSPANGATSQNFHPTLSWQAVASAHSYDVEVATDTGFNNIIISANTTGTSYSLGELLDEGAMYYWRVRAHNVCGSTESAAASFWTVAGSCPVGTWAETVYLEEFESGAPGWTHSAATGPDTWALINTNPSPGSGGYAYHATDHDAPADQRLVSAAIDLPDDAASLSLQFLNEQIFEDPTGTGGCWDGGLIEITTNGGATWTQLNSELQSDPYDGLGDNGPPAGRMMWCGLVAGEQPWINSIIDVSAYAGETVQFRLPLLSDAGAGAAGWN